MATHYKIFTSFSGSSTCIPVNLNLSFINSFIAVNLCCPSITEYMEDLKSMADRGGVYILFWM